MTEPTQKLPDGSIWAIVGVALFLGVLLRAQPPAPTAAIAAKPALPACTQTDCNCADFAYQEDAQAVLQAFPDDRFKLDGDHDGIACESLPSDDTTDAEADRG